MLHQSPGGAKRCKMFKIVVICRKKMGKAKKLHIFASLVTGWSESASSDLSLTTRNTGATHQFWEINKSVSRLTGKTFSHITSLSLTLRKCLFLTNLILVYNRIEVVAGLLYKHLNDCIWGHLGRSNDDISRTTCIIKRGGGKSARNCHLDGVESSITLWHKDVLG